MQKSSAWWLMNLRPLKCRTAFHPWQEGKACSSVLRRLFVGVSQGKAIYSSLTLFSPSEKESSQKGGNALPCWAQQHACHPTVWDEGWCWWISGKGKHTYLGQGRGRLRMIPGNTASRRVGFGECLMKQSWMKDADRYQQSTKDMLTGSFISSPSFGRGYGQVWIATMLKIPSYVPVTTNKTGEVNGSSGLLVRKDPMAKQPKRGRKCRLSS